MNFSKSISFSIFIILIFTTFMALAGIRGFLKLSPSIEKVNTRNTQTLFFAEQMLSEGVLKNDIKSFEIYLDKEKNNITEIGEAEKVQEIENEYKTSFGGNQDARNKLIKDITDLSKINRLAINEASKNVTNLSHVGIWVIVFALIAIWGLGLIMLKNLNKTIVEPLLELEDVFEKISKGNNFRRCPTIASTKDFQKIYEGVNQLLDK